MSKAGTITKDTNNKYARIFSSLFSSIMILALSALCLLNNLSIDLYTTSILLRIVVPGAMCFWVLGYAIGFILENSSNLKTTKKKLSENTKAYEIPSMFASTDMMADVSDDIF